MKRAATSYGQKLLSLAKERSRCTEINSQKLNHTQKTNESLNQHPSKNEVQTHEDPWQEFYQWKECQAEYEGWIQPLQPHQIEPQSLELGPLENAELQPLKNLTIDDDQNEKNESPNDDMCEFNGQSLNLQNEKREFPNDDIYEFNDQSLNLQNEKRESPNDNVYEFNDESSNPNASEESDGSVYIPPSEGEMESNIDEDETDAASIPEAVIETPPIESVRDEVPLVQNQKKEREALCPICYQRVRTHFARHLERHHEKHPQVQDILSLPPKSQLRQHKIKSLRKEGYFHLHIEKNMINPIRRSKNEETEYQTCKYCLGSYSKKLLYRHVKRCDHKPVDDANLSKTTLKDSSTFMAEVKLKNSQFFRKMRIYNEVFAIMEADIVGDMVRNDPLIILFGESLLNHQKRPQMATVVSVRMREVARMKIAIINNFNKDLKCLFDILKPDYFQVMINAVRIMCGWDGETKSFKASSLALNFRSSLKLLCDIGFKLVIERRANIPLIEINNRDQQRDDIRDLKNLIDDHYNYEISSLALKNLKENKWKKANVVPLSSDIELFNKHVKELAETTFCQLEAHENIHLNYRELNKCVLVMLMIFNRRRPAEVQYLEVKTYLQPQDMTNAEEFVLTDIEHILINKFKRIVSGGKGTKPVPLLISKKLQKYIDLILEIRRSYNLVPESNIYLFANIQSKDKSMWAGSVMRDFAHKCQATRPDLLTPTKIRKHMATTLQIMNLEADEMEQIATFMGHTKKNPC